MISKDEFRHALSRFASGVTIITTRDAGGNLHGITVSAFCSVSLEPPLILVCIDRNTGSHFALAETDAFVVNILGADQPHVSDRFASLLPGKFETVNYRSGIDGLPVLENALANLECRLVNSFEGGDHTIFVGRVESAIVNDGDPLVYFHGGYRRLSDD